MNPILLDTHVAIWASSGQLNASSRKAIDDAADRSELLLSPVTAWEIVLLAVKGRLRLAQSPEDYARVLFAQTGAVTAQLTPAIAAAAAANMRTIPDPADAMLVATAQAYGARLATRDRRIHAFAKATKSLRVLNV